MMIPDRQFMELLRAARAGDRGAIGTLFQFVEPYLLAVAERTMDRGLQSKGSAQDVVQEALLEAHRLVNRFEGSTFPEFRVWLEGVVRNKARAFQRHYRNVAKRAVGREQALAAESAEGRPLEMVPGAGYTPSSAASQVEEAARIAAALDRMGEEDRQVIVLRTLEGLTFIEVGRRMQRTEDAARMLWGRAVERLRDELENHS
jgi:RNA polymerase sigma-70 factor (ECF subfamily)